MIGHPKLSVYLNNRTNIVDGITPTVIGTVNTTPGIFGSCPSFPIVFADNRLVYDIASQNIQGTQASFTLAMWLYKSSNGNAYMTPYLQSGSDNNGISSNINSANNGLDFAIKNNTNGYTAFATIPFSNTTWIHVAWSFDQPSATLKAYKDGVLVGITSSLSNFTHMPFNNPKVHLGCNPNVTTRNWIGNIASQCFFLAALPISDIKRIMLGKHPLSRS